MFSIPQRTAFVFSSTLALLLSPGLSHAFDTECSYQGEPCSDGPGAARGQLTGDDHENEHSRIWRQTVDVAGIPDIINRPFTLSAVTGGETIIIGDETHLSQLPNSAHASDQARRADRYPRRVRRTRRLLFLTLG